MKKILKKLKEASNKVSRKLGKEQYFRSRVQKFAKVLEKSSKAETKGSKAERAKARARSEYAQAKIVHFAEKRDRAHHSRKEWEEREAFLEKKFKILKEKKQAKNASKGVVTLPASFSSSRRPVASWIVPWLEKSRKAGWKGEVVSGYRTPEYSEGLCQAMCDAPSCPGRCAGRSSGHSQKDFPGGCIDVTDYYNFKAIQYRIGSPLRNDLPSDPVHFSTSGH